MANSDSKTGYQKAVDFFGGVDGLRAALGLKSRQAIYMWRGKVPRARAFQIEAITQGKLTAADLTDTGKRSLRRERKASPSRLPTP